MYAYNKENAFAIQIEAITGKISEVSAFDENGDLRILTYGGND